MANTSLIPHPDYPALPQQATAIKCDAGCSQCPLQQTTGHKTASTFKLQNVPPVPDDARMNLKRFREMQGQIHRRAFDSDGIVASNNGASFDSWYYYNASRQFNFSNFSSWHVTACTGDQVTLEVTNPGAPDADARQVLHSFWREKDNVIGMYWVNGFYDVTAVQPLDMLEFQYPSKAHTLKSKILRIISCTQTTLTVQIDKNLSAVYNNYFPIPNGEGGFEDPPDNAVAKIYHYGREAENWFYIQEPHYFLGVRRQVILDSADVPANGIWELEPEAIAPPDGPDPLVPNFVMEGWNGSAWVVINETPARLHIKPSGASYAMKTTLPTGSIAQPLQTSLAGAYARFRATYYAAGNETDPNCELIPYDRCFHSRVDPSKSVGNYGANKGVGITPEGDHVFCGVRVYAEYEYVDDFDRFAQPPAPGQDGIPDRVNVTLHHPTGLDNFPTTTGKCIQYNYCNKYTNSLTKLGDRAAPFNIDHTMRFLLQVWFACDKRKHELYTLARSYTVERILHPSILWLSDYYGGMISPFGYNEKDYPRGNGTWFTAKPLTVTDAAGNESLMNASGLERALLYEYDPATQTYNAQQDRRGNIPANVAGFSTKRDPFDRAATVVDDLLEYIGCQIERDSMQIVQSRGLGNISLALGAEDIIAPNFDLNSTDLQQHSRATFQRDAVTGDGILKILPYRQEDKSEVNIGSRTIRSVTPLGGNLYQIEFENEVHTFSRFSSGDLGTLGDSYNQIFTVQAGGGPVILPYENQALNSHDGEKNTGSRAAGAMPLDCLEVMGQRFVIKSVTPHGGTEAATWGNRQVINKGGIGGFYDAPVNNDAEENPLTPITVTQVKRVSDNVIFPVLGDAEKPDLLAIQAWFDGGKRLYFSAENDGDYVEVKYTDRAEPTPAQYTNYFTVAATFTVDTQTDYSEWTGAATKTIYLGADAAIVIMGGTTPPAAGQVRINDNAGKIQLTFCIDDAPKDWRAVMTFNVEADPPQNDWAVGGDYLAFGKKRDICVVMADSYGGGSFFSNNSVAGESASVFQSASVFLPKDDLVLEWTAREDDDWVAVPANTVTPNAAGGTLVIDSDFFTANVDPQETRTFCFKVPGIQMVDNRGQVPASILNKTEGTLDAMDWTLTFMGGGGMGNFGLYSQYLESYIYGFQNPQDLCEWSGSDGDPYVDAFSTPYAVDPGNYFEYGWGSNGNGTAGAGSVILNYGSSSFSEPPLIFHLPDGTEIVEAWAQVNASGLTSVRNRSNFDHAGQCFQAGYSPPIVPLESDVTLTGIAFTVIGFTGPSSYDEIGTVSGATGKNQVINITGILQTMMAERKTRKYSYGYGLFFSPISSGGEGLAGFCPGEPSMATVPFCEGGVCFGRNIKAYTVLQDVTRLEWGSLSFGQIAMRVDYHDSDKLECVQPRFPSFADLPV